MARFVEVSVSYPIPHNWKWDSIGNYTKIKSGYPFDSEKFSDDPTGRQPLIRIRDILRESTNTFTDECCPEEYIIHAGDILIGMDGDFNVGKWNSDDALLNQRVCYIQSNSNCLLNDYLYYYLPGILKIINNATPSVTVKHLSANTLRKTQIPLPPLAEQQRIVDRIESLFAKLNEAKEKAQAVLDSFETRKAAILHKAFTGELTAKWREEHGVGMESWEYKTFEAIVENMQNGLAKRKGISGTPYVVLRLANLTDCGFNTDDLREILLDEKEQANYELRPNDVIMIRVNGSKDNVGKQYLITNQHHWAFCDHIIRIQYSNRLLPQYMIYFSRSKNYRIYVKENIVSSAGQNTISRKGMVGLVVPIPCLNEQFEIVHILDDLFSKEQQSKEAAEAVLDQIDLMKKSILARAFRGELGTNDPSEESAVELLKQIF